MKIKKDKKKPIKSPKTVKIIDAIIKPKLNTKSGNSPLNSIKQALAAAFKVSNKKK